MTNAPPPPGTIPCGSCGDVVFVDDAFCESCGATLSSEASIPVATPTSGASPDASTSSGCAQCGAAVGADHYCTACGHKQAAPRDHLEMDLGPIAGAVTDKGIRHHRNEDAANFGVAHDGRVVAVVCDGVSSSSRSDEASQAAVDITVTAVLRSLRSGMTATDALQEAALLANQAVSSIAADPGSEPPSCTFVAAVVSPAEVTWACIGDSRAYVQYTDEFKMLTTDDSWASLQVESGAMSSAEAMADRRAHVITRWLGIDSDGEPARTATVPLRSDAVIMLCSDGLWNEVPDPDIASMMATSATGGQTPVALARQLCAAANDAGGRDNITVIIVPPVTITRTLEPSPTPSQSTQPSPNPE
jgi:PPM family protein phosphatase